MRFSNLGNPTLDSAILKGAKLSGARLSATYLFDLDVGPLCDAGGLKHAGPSSIDCRTVIKSYQHTGLPQFMIDCGVPEIFVTYMVDCARAVNEPILRSLLQSTFISYGGPDEAFARRVYKALRAHQVVTFFFPETATVGEKSIRRSSEVFRNTTVYCLYARRTRWSVSASSPRFRRPSTAKVETEEQHTFCRSCWTTTR
jgi:hypothetical protein